MFFQNSLNSMSSIEFFLDFKYTVILHIGALLIIFVVDEDICLLMKQLIIFKQNLKCTAQYLLFYFLDPHRWLEIDLSVTFLGIDIFFRNLLWYQGPYTVLCDKAQVFRKNFLWKKTASNSKKTGFFRRKLGHQSLVLFSCQNFMIS